MSTDPLVSVKQFAVLDATASSSDTRCLPSRLSHLQANRGTAPSDVSACSTGASTAISHARCKLQLGSKANSMNVKNQPTACGPRFTAPTRGTQTGEQARGADTGLNFAPMHMFLQFNLLGCPGRTAVTPLTCWLCRVSLWRKSVLFQPHLAP